MCWVHLGKERLGAFPAARSCPTEGQPVVVMGRLGTDEVLVLWDGGWWSPYGEGEGIPTGRPLDAGPRLPMGPCYYCDNATSGNLRGWWLCSRDECLEAYDRDLDGPNPPRAGSPRPPRISV